MNARWIGCALVVCFARGLPACGAGAASAGAGPQSGVPAGGALAPAARINLVASDLGPQWAQVGPDEPSPSQREPYDRSTRQFRNGPQAAVVSVLRLADAATRGQAMKELHAAASAGLVKAGGKPHPLAPPGLGDEAVLASFGGKKCEVQAYLLTFRKADVVAQILLGSKSCDAKLDLVVQHARQLEARI